MLNVTDGYVRKLVPHCSFSSGLCVPSRKGMYTLQHRNELTYLTAQPSVEKKHSSSSLHSTQVGQAPFLSTSVIESQNRMILTCLSCSEIEMPELLVSLLADIAYPIIKFTLCQSTPSSMCPYALLCCYCHICVNNIISCFSKIRSQNCVVTCDLYYCCYLTCTLTY